MTTLALRLYQRMLLCSCHFQGSCSNCQLDLRALRTQPEVYSNLAEIERNFRADMQQIEAQK